MIFIFFFNSKNQTGGMEKHSWGLLLVWEPELPLPRNYQELLFLLILALLTAQSPAEGLLSSHLLGKGDTGRGESCRHGWAHTAQHSSVFLKSALFCCSKVLQNSWETFRASSQLVIVPLSLLCMELSPELLY